MSSHDDHTTEPVLPSGILRMRRADGDRTQPLPGSRPPARLSASATIRVAYDEHARVLRAMVVEIERDLRDARTAGRARLAGEFLLEELAHVTELVRRVRDERLREIE